MGSPPRVRGEEVLEDMCCSRPRITPACAGRRAFPPRGGCRRRDHPRVCGEKPRSTASLRTPIWITPACAGRRGAVRRLRLHLSDHPRVCGEKVVLDELHFAAGGSPPRVRGEVSSSSDGQRALRITPACAGRRDRQQAAQYWYKDHPRVCGEKSTGCATRLPCAGSPPRVRGEVRPRRDVSRPARITPACAGRSKPLRLTRLSAQDHPRVCGEKPLQATSAGTGDGSPPRVRGEVISVRADRPALGITPACAGRSSPIRSSVQLTTDHPRVCGEKDMKFSTLNSIRGSPPRVRGEVLCDTRLSQRSRITPACAGRS